jgi:hypothetical protein
MQDDLNIKRFSIKDGILKYLRTMDEAFEDGKVFLRFLK